MIDPNLPIIDLHRHLDGSIRLETILDLAKKYHIDLPASDAENLRPHVQVTGKTQGVMAFISKFKWMTAVLVDYEACYRVAFENVEDIYREGLDYAELRFSPMFMAETHGLDLVRVVDAVCEGVESAAVKYKMPVNLIGIISRTYGVDSAWKELNALLTQRERLIAIDLAGDEINQPGDLFVEHFARVKEAGLSIIAHAGESDGPESIWQAIDGLGAVRIGHAVRASEDTALMEYMVDREISIETNLTSNVQTSTVDSYASHPVAVFLEHGIKTNLNTDDPGISGIDLHYEYNVAAPLAGLDAGQVKQLQLNALDMAFISDIQRNTILNKN